MFLEKNKYEYDLKVTFFNTFFWLLCLFIGGFALSKFTQYIKTVPEPMQFMGTCFVLWFLVKWLFLLGLPQLVLREKR